MATPTKIVDSAPSGAVLRGEATLQKVLGKMGVTDKNQLVVSFVDPDFLGEPWAWLGAMILLSPQRSFFLDECDSPGRWSIAFGHGLSQTYGHVAPAAEQHQCRKLYDRMSREYFAWHTLGRPDGEGLRMVRGCDEIVVQARSLIDSWDTKQIRHSVGAGAADDFARVSAASRVTLSKRAATLLGGVLKVKRVSEPPAKAAVVLSGGQVQTGAATVVTPAAVSLTPAVTVAKSKPKSNTPQNQQQNQQTDSIETDPVAAWDANNLETPVKLTADSSPKKNKNPGKKQRQAAAKKKAAAESKKGSAPLAKKKKKP